MNGNTFDSPQHFDTGLFAKTTHNPSYASLTKQFTEINNLRDYCIPVNPYFPPADIMEKLQEKITYALKYYPGSNENIAENIAVFSDIKNPATIVAGNGSTEIISWLNSIFIKKSLFVPVPSFGRWIEEPQGLGIELHTYRYGMHSTNISAPIS
jgi:threonine-phosphate decarboxylase